jgi:hypothetical protein
MMAAASQPLKSCEQSTVGDAEWCQSPEVGSYPPECMHFVKVGWRERPIADISVAGSEDYIAIFF